MQRHIILSKVDKAYLYNVETETANQINGVGKTVGGKNGRRNDLHFLKKNKHFKPVNNYGKASLSWNLLVWYLCQNLVPMLNFTFTKYNLSSR